ncbi:MAG: Gfo/Idh/MocA family protein [Steroidobacteraceae bacterium]
MIVSGQLFAFAVNAVIAHAAEFLRHSGDLFNDFTIHDLDMARYLVGRIVEVQACGATRLAGGSSVVHLF